MNKNIYEALLSLKEKADAGQLENNKDGICFHLNLRLIRQDHLNISEARDITTEFMEEAYQTWNDFSGDYIYPVPSPDEDVSPDTAYAEGFDAGTMWQGAYGELRKSLLNHLIEFAKEASK